MKTFIHARLTAQERAALEAIKRQTRLSESDILRRGIALVAAETGTQPSALARAGASVGRFGGGPADLSVGRRHLDGFGK